MSTPRGMLTSGLAAHATLSNRRPKVVPNNRIFARGPRGDRHRSIIHVLAFELPAVGPFHHINKPARPDGPTTFAGCQRVTRSMPTGSSGRRVLLEIWGQGRLDLIDEELAERDLVMTRFSAEGTHLGVFLGAQPTGRTIAYTGMDLNCFVRVKIVESWVQYNALSLLQQLGAIPELPASQARRAAPHRRSQIRDPAKPRPAAAGPGGRLNPTLGIFSADGGGAVAVLRAVVAEERMDSALNFDVLRVRRKPLLGVVDLGRCGQAVVRPEDRRDRQRGLGRDPRVRVRRPLQQAAQPRIPPTDSRGSTSAPG